MSQIPTDPELGPLEAALAGLKPSPGPIDRDRLMFQAGVAAARAEARGRWAWPSIAAALALVAVSESIVLATRPERLVVVRDPAMPPKASAGDAPVEILTRSDPTPAREPDTWAGGGEALGLRRQVLRLGPEGLPGLPPLLSLSAGPEENPVGGRESPELRRRNELEKLLNPGGPS